MTAPAPDVRRRKVFYIPGFDPFPPRRYRELYRKESARQAEVSGYQIDITPGGADGRYGWQVAAEIDGQPVHADYEVLVWSDIVRDTMFDSLPRTYWHLARTSWTYLSTGALRTLFILRKAPVLAALYPIAVLLIQLALALLAAHLLGLGLSTLLRAGAIWIFGDGSVARWASALGYWALFFVTAVMMLRWFKSLDHRFYAYYLMQDYAFSSKLRGATPPELTDRLVGFRTFVAEALASDVDEVLVVGHSSGAHLAVEILADLLRDAPERPLRPALSFLSLGQVIPMVSFLPKAHKLRADLQFLSTRDDIVWVDVTAPGDGCAFSLCDPVAVSGVATKDKQWPLVFSAQFSRALGPKRWKEMRRQYFWLHFQYLCAFEHPLDYDYFQITAGPLSLGRRYADRPPSKSRIDVTVSKYTSVAP